MADNDGQWERGLIEKLATEALKEQKRARRWGIFWKLLTFAYITAVILLAIDWKGGDSKGGKHTALVEISGVIGPGTDASSEKISGALQAAFKDKNTQGVVLRINSPGGSPVQSQSIYDEMKRLRGKYPEIPLYVVVEDLCASGGYYVAAAADKIYVAKGSLVGSIGVRMDGFGVVGLMEKIGVERRLITAGKNKAMLDPFLPQDEAHKQIIVGLIGEIHDQFIAAVREGRGKRLKETPDMFSGLIWTGAKSVEVGLADAFGGLDYVAREVIKAEDIVDYTQKDNIAEKFARRFGADLKGKCFALWGLAFKPNTDDMREAPSRVMIAALLDRGARIQAYDPVAMEEAGHIYAGRNDVMFTASAMDAVKGADALVIMTEWKAFRSPDFDGLKRSLKSPVIFDGRNLYDPAVVQGHGLEYYAIGRGRRLEPRGARANDRAA